MNPSDLELVAPFVSSTEDNIYSIYGLPEEVISVLFAYVSRSPLSFRENLAKILKDGDLAANSDHRLIGTTERARKFHQKWVVNYGHDSVAEHTTIHIGVEKVSRIASEALERANPHLSFTEYSQRYQKPQMGDWHIPEEVRPFLEPFYERAYQAYEKAIDDFCSFLAKEEPGLSDHQRERRAIEEARYLLPLGMYTNLGMTGNARAIGEAVEVLWYSDIPEVRHMANGIVKAAQHVSPTLIRHPVNSLRKNIHPSTWVSAYLVPYMKGHYDFVIDPYQLKSTESIIKPKVFLADGDRFSFDLDNPAFSTERILHLMSGAGAGNWIAIQPEPDSLSDAFAFRRAVQDALAEVLGQMGKFDKLPPAFDSLVFRSVWLISEAAWHQLLRHRKVSFVCKPPSALMPYYVPNLFIRANEAGYSGPIASLRELADESKVLYLKILQNFELPGIEANPFSYYAVLNASTRMVNATMSVRAAWDLLRLRTKPNAQEEIRMACGMLADLLSLSECLGPAGNFFRMDREIQVELVEG